MRFFMQEQGIVTGTNGVIFSIEGSDLRSLKIGDPIKANSLLYIPAGIQARIDFDHGPSILLDGRVVKAQTQVESLPEESLFYRLAERPGDKEKTNQFVEKVIQDDNPALTKEALEIHQTTSYGFSHLNLDRITHESESAPHQIDQRDINPSSTSDELLSDPHNISLSALVDSNSNISVSELRIGSSSPLDDWVAEGGVMLFNVTLSAAPDHWISLLFRLNSLGSDSLSDFSEPQFSDGVILLSDGGRIIIPPGIAVFTVSVPINIDPRSDPGNNKAIELMVGDQSVTGQILDVDAPLQVVSIEVGAPGVNDDRVSEGQVLAYEIKLSGMSGRATEFTFSLGGGTANIADYHQAVLFTNGVTLNANGTGLVVPAGVSSFLVLVSTIQDGMLEPGLDETLPLTVGGVTAVGHIVDADSPVTITSIVVAGNTGITVAEGDVLQFEVTLNTATASTTTLPYVLSSLTAGPSDYLSPPTFSNGVTLSNDGLSLVIPSGISSFTVNVSILNDGVYEPGANETLSLTIDGVTAIGEIVDISSVPSVLSVEPGLPGSGDDAVLEGQSIVFNVALSNVSSIATNLGYSLHGSGQANVDFSIAPSFSHGVTLNPDGISLSVPAGVSGFSVTIPVFTDGLAEPGPPETVALSVGGTTGVGSIIDIDGPPQIASIQVGGGISNIVTEGQVALFTVTLSGISASTSTFAWSLGGAAQSGLDFSLPPTFSNGVTISSDGNSLIVPAGVTTFTMSVPTSIDGLYEPGADETLLLNVGGVTAQALISDNDLPISVFNIELGAAGTGDDAIQEGQSAVFTVTLSAPSSMATEFSYAFGSNTATLGVDYANPVFSHGVTLSPDGQRIIVPAGVTNFTVTSPVLVDNVYESGLLETFTLSVGGTSYAAGIIDIDSLPVVTSVEFGPTGSGGHPVLEGQELLFNVQLDKPAATTMSVSFNISGISAIAGLDYGLHPVMTNGVTLAPNGQTLFIPPGVTDFSIRVPTLVDLLHELDGPESLSVSVGGVVAIGQIVDADALPSISSVEAGQPGSYDDAVQEGDQLVFNVSLSHASSTVTTFAYMLGPGVAIPGIDYSPSVIFSHGVSLSVDGLSVIVPPGVTNFSISIPTLVDGVYEPHPNETVLISVGGVTAIGTISDFDSPPVVTSIEPGLPGVIDDTVTEGLALIYTVTLSNPSSNGFSIPYTLGGGTAIAGQDFAVPPVFGNGVILSQDGLSLVIPAGIGSFTVTVLTLPDGVYEAGGPQSLPLTVGGVTANSMISDIDIPPSVTAVEVGAVGGSDDEVNEGQTLAFNVSLSNASATVTHIAFSIAGTAIGGLDYISAPTFSHGVTLNANGITLDIPAGVSSFTINVQTSIDGLYEPGANETVLINVGGVLATGAITDLDTAPQVVSVEPGLPGTSDDAVLEGESLVFHVTLSGASNVATTLSYLLGGGSAIGGVDYSILPVFTNGVTLNPGGITLNIPAGVSSFSIQIPTTVDGIYEAAPETVPITVGGVTATGEITDISNVPTVLSVEPGATGAGDDSVLEGQSLV